MDVEASNPVIGCLATRKVPGKKSLAISVPRNTTGMRMPDASNRERPKDRRLHFVDRARQIGGFYDERLTMG